MWLFGWFRILKQQHLKIQKKTSKNKPSFHAEPFRKQIIARGTTTFVIFCKKLPVK